MRRLAFVLVAVACLCGKSVTAATDPALESLEKRVVAEPESLRLAADYRQLVIANHAFDRAITLFERLSKRPGAGANAFLNLAFAYVDKVPVSGTIRQAYLGKDAIHALTRAIELGPSDLAYYVRGLVNLYYDKAIFNRTDKGVADLEEARRIASQKPHVPYMARILQTLGDGYFRQEKIEQARQAWREGASLAPSNDALRERLSATDAQLRGIIARALDAGVRVDTSLHELDSVLPVSSGGQR